MIIYCPKISYDSIKIFKNYGINLVSSKNSYLKALFRNVNDKIGEGEKSEKYKINYEEWDYCYVGRIKRKK